MDDFEEFENENEASSVPIAPIMDMLVAIVFFLLLSSSFFNLTQQNLPVEKSVKVSAKEESIIRSPRILIIKLADNSLRCLFVWDGQKAGQRTIDVKIPSLSQPLPQLTSQIVRLINLSKSSFPTEKTIRLGLSGDLPHQVLVSSLDAFAKTKADVSLISYREVQSYMDGEYIERNRGR